ncbi:MAG: prepilin-type N-terminal cleavage/methylation domain-containing protein [Phycisphaerae bacterium]|jgi:prepilin-type N-terminal cleavage/methylation domain-containing protein
MRLLTPRERIQRRGFTLIEVLVVVAIIALLISILLPSLKRAKEVSRRTVCLSNLHQMGVGMVPYAQDHKGLLPQKGSFSYYIAEYTRWHQTLNTIADKDLDSKVPINYGMLYGKYTGKDLNLFYCPNVYEGHANHPQYGAHTFLDRTVKLTFGGYSYAAPVTQAVQPGKTAIPSPRYDAKGPYPEDIWDEVYRSWVSDKRLGLRDTPQNMNWRPRRHQALMSDILVGEGKTRHMGGVSSLFSDFHAKFVKDAHESWDQVTKGQVPYIAGRGITSGAGGLPAYYDVWNYLSVRY